MKKVLVFIATHLAKVDAFHNKVVTIYGLWTSLYEAIKPLLPSGAAAEVAPAAEVTNQDPAPAPVLVAQ